MKDTPDTPARHEPAARLWLPMGALTLAMLLLVGLLVFAEDDTREDAPDEDLSGQLMSSQHP